MKSFKNLGKWKSFDHAALVYYTILIVCAVRTTLSQLERAVAPKEENALSLWLITRTGWVYCERAAVYMDRVEQRFNEVKCKKCYMELFQNYKRNPQNLTDGEIVKCSRNFGANMMPALPSLPSFMGFDNTNERQLFPARPLEFFRQINPLETVGVRAFTCNSEVSKNSNLRVDRVIMPAAGSIFQLFSTRDFTSNNDTKREYPRKSYVSCLFGKLFETELALCPINTTRRRCAIQQRQVDEDNIFSTNIPISYDGLV